MQEIAERKAAKAERKHEAMAAIRASLTLGGWLCPGCDRWNLSFRDLCFRCNGKRTAAGVFSRGIPDPRRHDGDRAESDSDDSVELQVQREEQEQLEAMMRPFLRSTRTKRGSGSKKRGHPSGGTPSRGGKGKKGKGRAGAAAWLGVGVVATTCRGTGLVRGPALSSLPPRPVGRAAPARLAAFGRSHSGFVAGTARAATSYTWALTRRVLNRLAHICTGNISAWAGVAAALAAPVLFSIQRGSVGVVDDTLAAVAQQSADLIHEVGTEAARTVQVAGRALSVITLILCAAATWFVARAVLNRLIHALKGNTLPAVLVELVGGEATFAVEGKRSRAMHKVWIRLDSRQSACGCRAYLQEGTCGHCDAAVQAAVQMGLVRPEQAAAAPEGRHLAELSSRVIAKGLAALPDRECFSGLAAKSRELSCLSGLLKLGGSSPGAPAGTTVALSVPAPAAAIAAQGPRRNKASRADSTSRGGQEIAYLAGDAYIAGRPQRFCVSRFCWACGSFLRGDRP